MLHFSITPVTPYRQNCTLLICGRSKKAAVIDPGGDVELLLDWVRREEAQVEAVLLTHGHLDHVGGAAELAAALGAPIWGPRQEDDFLLQGLPEQARYFGFPYHPPLTPDRWLNDGETVTIGDLSLQVLHCPGHTPGHVVFFSAEEQLALVGDVLFKGSIGRTDFPRGDHQTLLHSITRKLWPLGQDVRFIPGHGPMSTFGYEMRNNPFLGAARAVNG